MERALSNIIIGGVHLRNGEPLAQNTLVFIQGVRMYFPACKPMGNLVPQLTHSTKLNPFEHYLDHNHDST